MAALASTASPRLFASDDELRATGPSYTADTLERQHAARPGPHRRFSSSPARTRSQKLQTWQRYPAVLDLANFVVVSRPGHALDDAGGAAAAARAAHAARGGDRRRGAAALDFAAACGDARRVVDRRRERARRGEPITGLVPPLVEIHIRQHRLYFARAR